MVDELLPARPCSRIPDGACISSSCRPISRIEFGEVAVNAVERRALRGQQCVQLTGVSSPCCAISARICCTRSKSASRAGWAARTSLRATTRPSRSSVSWKGEFFRQRRMRMPDILDAGTLERMAGSPLRRPDRPSRCRRLATDGSEPIWTTLFTEPMSMPVQGCWCTCGGRDAFLFDAPQSLRGSLFDELPWCGQNSLGTRASSQSWLSRCV